MASKKGKVFPLPPVPHAELSASGAERWLACPGSIQASKGMVDVPREPAALGTVAHHVAAECLKTNWTGDSFLGDRFSVDGFEFQVDEDMVEAVNVYLDVVRTDQLEGGGTLAVESSLTEYLVWLDKAFGGISDGILLQRGLGLLRVYDYKHGEGLWVPAKDNKQLKYYALGALLGLEDRSGIHEVEIVVTQPRCHQGDATIRRWRFPAIELLDFERDLVEGAEATRQANPPLNPGSWCRWCLAKALPCAALAEAERKVLSADFADLTAVKEDGTLALSVTPEKLAGAMQLIPALELRIKDIREMAYSYLNRGIDVEGFKLVAKRGTRKWVDEEAAKAEWGKLPDAWTEPKLKSVAQMEKVVGKAKFKEVAADKELVAMVSSGHTVVVDHDPRPAIEAVTSASFDNLEDKQ